MDPDIYKITSINDDGVDVTAYVLPSARNMYRRMMLEQYGNVEDEGMSIEDVPDDIKKQIDDAGILRQ